MKKVEEKLTVLSQDAAMILCYDEEEYKEIVREAVIRTEVEEAKDTALKEGREEGIKQGIEEGIKEGIKEGIHQEKTKVAQSMLNKGLDKELIKEITGLSLEEIKDLDYTYSLFILELKIYLWLVSCYNYNILIIC